MKPRYEKRIPKVISNKTVDIYGYTIREHESDYFYTLLTAVCQAIYDEVYEGLPPEKLDPRFPTAFKNLFYRVKNDYYMGKWNIELTIIEE